MKYKISKKGDHYAIYVKKSWWRRYEGLYHEGVNIWSSVAEAINHLETKCNIRVINERLTFTFTSEHN